MEKHISLVGVLNIVYRTWAALGGIVLLALAFGFDTIMFHLQREHVIHPHDVPEFVFDLIPVFLGGIGVLILIVSAAGIIGGVGVLKRKEWGRILVLIVSFFNLLRVPLGTLLGGYSIWALMNDEMIRLFNPPNRT